MTDLDEVADLSDPEALMARAAAPVIRDALRTREIRLAVSRWHDPAENTPLETGIGWVFHEAGTTPTQPVWEIVDLLRDGDCLAIHPFLPSTTSPWIFPDGTQLPEPPPVTVAQLVSEVADKGQQLLHMLLYLAGRDPSWPLCRRHSGPPLLACMPSQSPRPIRTARQILPESATDSERLAAARPTEAEWAAARKLAHSQEEIDNATGAWWSCPVGPHALTIGELTD